MIAGKRNVEDVSGFRYSQARLLSVVVGIYRAPDNLTSRDRYVTGNPISRA